MRILLVENDLEIRRLLKESLIGAGFDADWAQDARTAYSLAAERNYDVVIVDFSLPDQDGIDLILELRRRGLFTPVVILSTSRSVDDRVKGLEVGGGDFLTKPFAIAELIARIRNLTHRSLAGKDDLAPLKIMDLEMDLVHRKATRQGEVLNLSPQEFSLLEYLGRHAGRVVTRSMLLSEVWGMRVQTDTNLVEVHIYRLRGKLDGDGRKPLIQTLRGVGYVLRDK